MSFERRDVVGGAIATTLSSGINSGVLSFSIAVATGWPTGANGDFFVVIDRGNANEEKIRCASRSSLTVTVQTGGRGSDGTSGVAHDSGAAVEHCISAVDVDEANYAVNETVGKITAVGDLLVGDGTASLDNLAIGTTGHPLVAGASTPAYGQVGTSGIADDAITSAKVATDAIGSAEIAADAVGTSEIAADSVTTSELADDAVATANIATGAVTADEIGAAAVTSTKLDSGVVDDSTIQFNSGVLRVKDVGVTTAKLADASVTSAKEAPITGGRWRRTANQSVPNTTVTAITWPTETYDSDGLLTPTSSTITIQSTGVYLVNFRVTAGADPGSSSFLTIAGSGTAQEARTMMGGGTGVGAWQSNAGCTLVAGFTAADTIACYVFHNNGSSVNFQAEVSVVRIGHE